MLTTVDTFYLIFFKKKAFQVYWEGLGVVYNLVAKSTLWQPQQVRGTLGKNLWEPTFFFLAEVCQFQTFSVSLKVAKPQPHLPQAEIQY
jgi:hypothetical protein